MGAWGTAIFSDDLAMDIRREYNILLSVGKDNNTIEEMLINYYAEILNCNDPDEDVFWFALALSEWKKGRLSDKVKAKALFALENNRDLERWKVSGNEKDFAKRKKVLEDFRDIILQPMPPIKKVKKPTVHHCPWKVGSLLAYRIVSNKKLFDHPCYMKYVLLRLLRIEKHPVSRLFDTEYYNETMLVGLYDWIGSEIPHPTIVDSLDYIPIDEYNPPCSNNFINLFEKMPGLSSDAVAQIIDKCTKKRIEKCVWLDWRSSKEEVGDITYLGCDESYQNMIPNFFKDSLTSNTLTHYWPFDITLSKKFNKTGDGSAC